MSNYTDASLIMYPSGYKEDKIYSLKPTDGSGDLTFTRASTATRVNAEGLIETSPVNLFQYSQDFTNAAFTKVDSTFSGNTLTAGAGTTFKGIFQNEITQGSQTVYFDVEYISHQWVQIGLGTGASDLGYVNFDIQNKIVGTQAGGFIGSIVDYGSFIRIIATINSTDKTSVFLIFVNSTSSSRADATSSTGAIKLFKAQLNIGATAKPYFPTTDRLNVPRIDYTGGGCGKLLLEPQRTNLVTYSEQFDNVAWIGDRKTITANATTSPDGTQNADLLTATATLGTHNINPSTLINLLSSAGTFSVFAKYNGYNLSLSIAGSSTNWTGCVFDLQNGIARTPQSSGAQSPCTAKIEDFGNGWYRCSISYTPYTSGTFYTFIGATSTNNSTLVSFGLEDFTANGTSGFYLYGAQVEANASYVSSYIPTLASSVTRLADAASKTGIGSLIGTEFTLFYDGYETTGGQSTRYIALKGTGGTYANAVIIEGQATNQIFVTVLNNSSTTVYASSRSGLTNGQRIKLAVRCKNNDFAFYVNGSLATAQASGSVPTTSTLYLGYYIDYDDNYSQVNQAIIFPTGLTNAQLAELTTL